MTSLLRSTLVLALLTLPLAAQTGPAHGPRAGQISRVLNLTEAQKASIRNLRDKHRADLVLRRDAVDHARIDLRTALRDPATPETRLRALYDKAAAARFESILAERSLRLEVRALLTPEQRAQADEMRSHAGGRMHGRRGHRPMSPWLAD
jgi:Spy/CpxP family protein refolding chaperone